MHMYLTTNINMYVYSMFFLNNYWTFMQILQSEIFFDWKPVTKGTDTDTEAS